MSKIYTIIFVLFCFVSCELEEIFSSENPNSYKKIEEGISPFPYRVYELENGLKVYLSKNKKEPRIQTNIGVKFGSKNDPLYQTGLANFIEHMMYNGTSEIGTDNWLKESVILDQIVELFEQRKYEINPSKRSRIFQTIDSLSILASEHSIANEYTKLVNEIGGQSINSYTSFDETVFSSSIPSSEIEKWAKIESERFSEITCRNFTIELEQIYQEYNSSRNSDDKLIYKTIAENLFINHPYGSQSIMGKIKHLKNPSIKEIFKFFDTFYIPNNMIIALSGDLDYEQTIDIINNEFSKLERKSIEKPEFNAVDRNGRNVKNIYGLESEQVVLSYRLNGLKDDNSIVLNIIDRMFLNGYNGLLETDLLTRNKLQDAYCFPWLNIDYSTFIIGGFGNANQDENEVRKLLLNEIGKIKNGTFPSDFPSACLNDLKKEFLLNIKSNNFRSNELLYSGLYNKNSNEYLNRFNKSKGVSKEQIVSFAQRNFDENYVVVNKRKGERKQDKILTINNSLIKLRNGYSSKFYKEITQLNSVRNDDNITQFDKEFSVENESELYCLNNTSNELFSFNIVFDFGSFEDPLAELALEYLKLIGSQSKSNSQINTDLFKKGASWKVLSNSSSIIIKIEGLDTYFEESINEILNIFRNPKFNKSVFRELIKNKKKVRKDLEYKSSYLLWEALLGQTQYGEDNPYISSFSNVDLDKISESAIISAIKNMLLKPHELFYFGSKNKTEVSKAVKNLVDFPGQKIEIKSLKIKENTPKKEVLFVYHEMSQTELLFVGRKGKLDEKNRAFNLLFNAYFSSFAYSELRESQALAYSTYVAINEASTKGQSDFVYGFLGCQVDNLSLALGSMETILKTSPTDETLFEKIKLEVIQSYKNRLFDEEAKYWEWKKLKRKGFVDNHYQKTLRNLQSFEFEKFVDIFNSQIKTIDLSLLIVGDENDISKEDLLPYGPLRSLKKHEILP